MKRVIVYKVVARYGQTGYLSVFNSIFRCQYQIEETITNKKMPLFAFDTLENARDFNSNYCNVSVIFKCNAVVSPMQPRLRADTCYNQFKLFWKQVKNKKKVTAFTSQKSPGTIFCSSITPLEIVN